MSKECEIYIKQIIELAEKEMSYLIVSASTINEIKDDRELGTMIREVMNEKVKDCNKTIKEFKKKLNGTKNQKSK